MNIFEQDLTGPQQEWWDLPKTKFVRVFSGGYGSGKDEVLIRRMIWLSLVNNGLNTAVVAPNVKLLRLELFPTLVRLLDYFRRISSSEFDYAVKIQHNPVVRIDVKHKNCFGRIHIFTDVRFLQGANFPVVGMYEAFMQSSDAFSKCLVRLRDPNAKRLELLIAGTPPAEKSWGQDLCEGKLPGLPSESVGVVHAHTNSNPHTGQEYKDRLNSAYTDHKEREAYLAGNFVS